jgi:two-component system, chemotaxis family, chemotaxis protein CheY
MVKVLVVDDTKSVHAFLKSLLSHVPEVEVTPVYNGAEAVELLGNRTDFDLILLDWEMPVMTGPEAFQRFLEMGIRIPTVMMTTKNQPADIEKMLLMGVVEYLLKPFTLDILVEKMEFALGKGLACVA